MNSFHRPVHARPLRARVVEHPTSVWLVLEGEADIASLPDLDATLRSVPLTQGRSVHLHAHGLRFVDLKTIRLLTKFARHATRAGHPVMTCHAPPTVQRLSALLDAQADLGLIPDPEIRAGAAPDPGDTGTLT